MAFSISKAQQKIFIENFMSQSLTVALQLLDQGKDHGSPGETFQAIGQAIIAQLRTFEAPSGEGEL